MYDEIIKLSHPAYDFYKDHMYYGLLIPVGKDKIIEDILKDKKVKTTVSYIIDDEFNILSKSKAIEKDIFITSELNQDFCNCSIKLLNILCKKQSLKMPDFKNTYSKIISLLKEYCYFENEAEYHILACYIIGSYHYRSFAYYPIIHLFAERGSGKTAVSKFIEFLGFNSYYTLNITKAGLSRVNSQRRGIVIIDEKENINDNDDLKLILNGCFQKGSKEVLTEKNKDGNYEVVYFELYAPVVIASINPIYGATSDRMIRIEMKRHEVCKNIFEDQDSGIWQEIRDSLFLCSLAYWKDIKNIYNDYSCDFLKNRDLDIWKPLLSLYKYFENNELMSDYVKDNYFSYKQDIQEFSYSSLLCDYILQHTADCQVIPSSELFNGFKNSLKDDKFLFEHTNQTMFGSVMRRIGFVGELKQHTRLGNLYVIKHSIVEKYNANYFYKDFYNDKIIFNDKEDAEDVK